ncbi:MAG: hypothetical protein WAU07_01310 [Microgenomates group bacterium]
MGYENKPSHQKDDEWYGEIAKEANWSLFFAVVSLVAFVGGFDTLLDEDAQSMLEQAVALPSAMNVLRKIVAQGIKYRNSRGDTKKMRRYAEEMERILPGLVVSGAIDFLIIGFLLYMQNFH